MDKLTSQLIDAALQEDIGPGDVTAGYFVPEEKRVLGKIVVREAGVVAGLEIAAEVFRRVDEALEVRLLETDGFSARAGAVVIEIEGSARSILTAERTALNFLQRLSGIATKTSLFVGKTAGTRAEILDTRKTTPGWRWLEKMAVRAGGGTNHRMGLYDRAMVKDNHLVAEDRLAALQSAIDQLKKDHPEVEIELEADELSQVRDFLTLSGVRYLLLDNMSLDELRDAVALRGEKPVALEASGGVNLETVEGIAQTGVDYISVGALTHSAVALDLAMDFHDLA